MIEIKGLTKSFKGTKVLDNLSLKIPHEKISVVIGPSGTGKTILLKHILGLIKPDSGQIFVDGKDIGSMNQAELNETRKTLGVCFQDAALFDSMTVGENVAFPLRIHTDLKDEEIKQEVSSLLAHVGLSGIENKMPSQISGGMRKRVGLARAIALNPKVILFDEPTTGLDPVLSNAIYELIHKTQEKTRATCLIISHDIKGAFALADFMAMLYNGRIVFEGDPSFFRDTKDPLVKQFIEGATEGPINPVQ
jgi:phospholipid/cholesterol/gamma-HCH transport system ATP-binding protein